MEPIGTITKYYQFVDEETKSILSTLMDEASSYYDFVNLLQYYVKLFLRRIAQIIWSTLQQFKHGVSDPSKT